MASAKPRKPPRPLDEERLQELAIRYVGKYATTRAKLRAYLARKVRERGWDGARHPDIEGLAERLAELGYVDDRSYAISKAQSLTGRGYGRRRVDERLKIAGISDDDGEEARRHADDRAVEAALAFARRRRIGPFAPVALERDAREKAIAALVRAGHGFVLARAIVEQPPGAEVDPDELAEQLGLN